MYGWSAESSSTWKASRTLVCGMGIDDKACLRKGGYRPILPCAWGIASLNSVSTRWTSRAAAVDTRPHDPRAGESGVGPALEVGGDRRVGRHPRRARAAGDDALEGHHRRDGDGRVAAVGLAVGRGGEDAAP